MGLIDNVNVNVGGNGNIIDTLSTYVTKLLKPNIVDGKNVLTQDMMSVANTKYVIKYNFNLVENIIVPAGCVLKFEGGSIAANDINDTITLNNTLIEGKNGFEQSVILEGACKNAILYSDIYKLDDTGVEDCTIAVQSLVDICKSTLVFAKGTYKFSRCSAEKDIEIDGNDSVFKAIPLVDGYDIIRNFFTIRNCNEVIVRNATFEGNNGHQEAEIYPQESAFFVTNVKNVFVHNCKFQHLTARNAHSGSSGAEVAFYEYWQGITITCKDCHYVKISNCEFFDNLGTEWIYIAPLTTSYLTNNSTCIFEDNYFHNYEGDEERSNSPISATATTMKLFGNITEHYTYKGSCYNVFGLNVFAKRNVIKACHFRSGIDTCEWGLLRNDFVDISDNNFQTYNGCGCVVSSKKAYIDNNVFEGENGINVYCTYFPDDSWQSITPHPCDDFCTVPFGAGENIVVTNNKINADYVDLEWVSGGTPINSGVTEGIYIFSQKEIGKDILLKNNVITINPVTGINKDYRQPIKIRNFSRNLVIEDNICHNGVTAMNSSVFSGFVYIDNTLEMDYKSIQVCRNQVYSDTPSPYDYKNEIVIVKDYYSNAGNRVDSMTIENNSYINNNTRRDVVLHSIDLVINDLKINQGDYFRYSDSAFAAINITTDVIIPYMNVVSPKYDTLYLYADTPFMPFKQGAGLRCLAKYYTDESAATEKNLRNKTAVAGDIVRVSSSCIYLLLSASHAFGNTLPAITETTNNSIISWDGANWLVLTRNNERAFSFTSNASDPSIDNGNVCGLFYNIAEKRLKIFADNAYKNILGWKDVAFKGATSIMTSLGLSGGDEGQLFYNTDVKLWCQMYVDRSNGATICWQILGSGRGSTAKRPTVLTTTFGVGFTYFDTTLNKMIWWTGDTTGGKSGWVTADGADSPNS